MITKGILRCVHACASQISNRIKSPRQVLRAAAFLVVILLATGPLVLVGRGQGETGTRKKQVKIDGGREGAEYLRRRAEWFFHPRAFPRDHIPDGLRLRAIEQVRQMRQASLQSVTSGTAPQGLQQPVWQFIGPQPTNTPFYAPFVSGRIISTAVDPCDATFKTVYIAGANGGVWRTTDDGQTWTPLTDSQPSLASGALLIDPASCSSNRAQRIWIGTGEENFAQDSFYGAGVLRSTDGGQTWTQDSTFHGTGVGSDTEAGPYIGAMALRRDASQNLTLFAAVLAPIFGTGSTFRSGIYRSTDGGAAWTRVQVTSSSSNVEVATDVAVDPANPLNVYAALGFPAQSLVKGTNGVYKSTDGGMTWSRLTALDSFGSANFGRIILGIGTGALYAAIANGSSNDFSSDLLGMFKSTDGGNSWSAINFTGALAIANGGYCSPQCFYDMPLRVSPANPNVVVAGGSSFLGQNANLIRSTDGGITWSEISNEGATNGLHPDEHGLAFAPDGKHFFSGNDGGEWETSDVTASTVTWSNLNLTLGLTQFYSGISIHPSTPALGFGGTQDNGAQRYSGSLAWDDTQICGDGAYTAIDPFVPSTVYISCVPFGQALIWQSLINGLPGQANWIFAGTGIDPNDPTAFVPPFIADPAVMNQLYFGATHVWRSSNAGASWSQASPVLTQTVNNVANVIKAIAVAPMNPNVIYAGTDDPFVWVTTNNGQSWTNVTSTLPGRIVTDIAVDPNDAAGKTAYVTVSGFSGVDIGDTQGHVFLTTTGGTAWLDISGNLPNLPVNAIVIDPDVPNTLFVATDFGVFTTANANAVSPAWSLLGTGLANSEGLGLTLNRAARILRVGTHGRGMWDLALPNFTPAFHLSSLSQVSANAGSPAPAPITLTGNGFTGSSRVQFTISGNAGSPFTFVPSSNTATSLTATISTQALSSAGTAQVAVVDATQNPSTTNSLAFSVLNATPTLNSIQTAPPTPTVPAGNNVTITANGTGFLSSSAVQFTVFQTTTNLTTNFVNSGQLTATLPANMLQFGGVFPVNVFNQPPGGGASNAINLVIRGAAPPNDNFANATTVSSGSFTNTVDSSGATKQGTDPIPPCTNFPPSQGGPVNGGSANSVWYQFTPAASGSVEVDTIGSLYDTILTVWTGSQGSLTNVACNDDIVTGVVTVSQLNFNATANTTYFIMVSAFSGDGGKTVLNLTAGSGVAAPYSVSPSPSSNMVAAGNSANYTINISPNGFSGNILFSCGGLPAKAGCVFGTNPVPEPGNASTSLMITTARNTLAPPSNRGPFGRLRILMLVWVAAALIALTLILRGRNRIAARRLGYVLLALLVASLLASQAACGGGGGGQTFNGTPPGTYTITITGSPAGANTSTSVQLIVQ